LHILVHGEAAPVSFDDILSARHYSSSRFDLKEMKNIETVSNSQPDISTVAFLPLLRFRHGLLAAFIVLFKNIGLSFT